MALAWDQANDAAVGPFWYRADVELHALRPHRVVGVAGIVARHQLGDPADGRHGVEHLVEHRQGLLRRAERGDHAEEGPCESQRDGSTWPGFRRSGVHTGWWATIQISSPRLACATLPGVV